MPKTTITYRIFVASPNDVPEERNIVRSIAEELNKNNTIKNIKLDVIGWESDTFPSFADDAQAVINHQIDDDYDIFIGIFWSRFGTATLRDSSGTKEEFERAYKRYSEDNNSVHILMYFKDAPIPISKIDLVQIENIRNFHEDIKKRGGYTKTFNTTDEFESLIRNNLTQLLNKITASVEKKIQQPTESSSLIILEQNDEIDEEEHGLFEYIDIAVKSLDNLFPEIGKLTENIAVLGEKMTKRTTQINRLKNKPKETITRETRKIIDLSSTDFDQFNNNCSPLIPIMNSLFNDSMKNFNKAFLIHKEYIHNEEEKAVMLTSLLSMKQGITGAHESCTNLNNEIKKLPPLTTKLLKSRNKTTFIMSQIANEFLTYINIIDDIISNSF